MTKARLELREDGRLAFVTLAAPKANILDQTMVENLDSIFAGLESNRDLCAVVVGADGPHFSFGASIEEHLPDQIEGALARLGHLLRRMVAAPAPVIAAVRGQCLGGGFELVLACDFIVAEETAQFGAPEIRLGVFPPAASAILPVRIGVAPAASLTLTGASISGLEAKSRGLVARTTAAGKLDEELDAILKSEFLLRSPAGLRHAALAVRGSIAQALEHELPRLDQLYLKSLMSDPNAVEGILAFLAKREPQWKRHDS